jgi:P4 family phage/plasmid primase-like protien
MTNNIKQINKEFFDFLTQHRVIDKNDKNYTHTSFGMPFGKYNIKDGMDYDNFLHLYKKILETGVSPELNYDGLHITEKQKDIGPMYIDYDFRFKESTRQYTYKNIEDITTVYMNLIKKYLKLDNLDDLKAYVTEKQQPAYDEKQQNYKDGFHIIFPLPIDVSIRFLIHDEAKEEIKNSDILVNLNYINSFDEVIDEAVIIRNGWLMYGSKKQNKLSYNVTQIYNHDMKLINKNLYTPDEYVCIFSARQYIEGNKLELNEKYNNDKTKEYIEKIYNKYNGTKKQKNTILMQEKINKYNQPETFTNNKMNNLNVNLNNPDVIMARKLVNILSATRADKYMDWAPVGWALYNIDIGLYESFVDFSKKCPNKYSEDNCIKFWNNCKNGGYSIASLHYWAKQDNSEEYNKILLESINKYIDNAETGNHDDLAKLLYEMYKYEYKCVSKARNKWYEFFNNRWNFVDSAYTLANKISDIIAPMFFTKAVYNINKTVLTEGGEKDNGSKKYINLLKIIEKLKTESFKNSVISSAASRFIDKKFEEKLDSNCNLIGFENGVYDLENGIFRKGVPEDYVSLSTGYDYDINYTHNSKDILDIKKYFEQVMMDEDMREYTLLSFSSFLDGHIKQQVFRVYTGSGGNGKSQTMDLLKLTLGGYYGILDAGIITTKRGNSSNATPELADKRGKRYLVIQEPEHDDVIYVGKMKNYTGGDTITARALYGDQFEYKPQFKLGLICNKLPNIPSTDGGTWRRLKVIPFESEFVSNPTKINQFKIDMTLGEKMKTWGPPFMWLLTNVYYKRYKENNYIINEPKKVTLFTDNYKRDSDKYHEFISEYIVNTNDHNDIISSTCLYNTFKNWHIEAGYGRTIPNKRDFNTHITSNKNFILTAGNFTGICYKEDYEEKLKKNNKNNDKNNKNVIIVNNDEETDTEENDNISNT